MKYMGGFLIAKIHQTSNRIFSRMLKQHNIHLNSSQGRIMFTLWKKGPMSISELGHSTSLGKSTLTSMLDILERDGYIKRMPSKLDRRVIKIVASELDEKTRESCVSASEQMTSIFYKDFSREQIKIFEKNLFRILENVEKYGKDMT